MVRICLVILVCLISLPALAEKRVALVIGNSAYLHTQRLAVTSITSKWDVTVPARCAMVIIQGATADGISGV